jgi:hypothetical protein
MATSALRMQVAEHLQALSSDRVKSLVVQWLLETDSDLEGFQQSLTDDGSAELEWGEITMEGAFRPLSEAEMIAGSMAALKQYQKTGQSFSQESMQQWADSLSHDGES